MVSEDRIAAVLAAAGSAREAVRTLVDEANGAGGRDNITALAFRLGDAAAPLGECARGRDAGRRRRRGAASPRPRCAAAPQPPRPRVAASSSRQSGHAAACAPRRSCSPPSRSSPRWPLAPGTATDRSGSSAPTTAAASPSTEASPTNFPLGLKLYDEHYASPVQTRALSGRRRDAVTGHDVRSREDAVFCS